MKDLTQIDYIVVGQGLAGSAVALQLIKRGKKILVIDKPDENTSSRVAAGLFNPFTGIKLKKTWLADLVFPYFHTFYKEAEKITHQKFFKTSLLYRPFYSIEEQNEWMGKSVEHPFVSYIEKISTTHTVPDVNDQFGGLLLNQCGHLEAVQYLAAVRTLIQEKGIFINDNYIDNELQAGDDGITYMNYAADKIIFCQGEQIDSNKWFNWLPVIPLKGETLRIRTTLPQQHIINRGVYIVPAAEDANDLRVGSTYNWDDLERNVTSKAKTELVEKLYDLVSFNYQIIDQKWGMRPTTRDRYPLLGAHPMCKSVVIFNGLGTKGVSLAPYFSEILIQWIEGEIDLNKEVDVNRYKSLYSKSTK